MSLSQNRVQRLRDRVRPEELRHIFAQPPPPPTYISATSPMSKSPQPPPLTPPRISVSSRGSKSTPSGSCSKTSPSGTKTSTLPPTPPPLRSLCPNHPTPRHPSRRQKIRFTPATITSSPDFLRAREHFPVIEHLHLEVKESNHGMLLAMFKPIFVLQLREASEKPLAGQAHAAIQWADAVAYDIGKRRDVIEDTGGPLLRDFLSVLYA
ncbi:hypothetical protein DXG01_009300 [Tephrocybe rancida]|nr:hypothetical protein DXG01_009300 [Tephrocybe rancida]